MGTATVNVESLEMISAFLSGLDLSSNASLASAMRTAAERASRKAEVIESEIDQIRAQSEQWNMVDPEIGDVFNPQLAERAELLAKCQDAAIAASAAADYYESLVTVA
jgi:hypothetical protein